MLSFLKNYKNINFHIIIGRKLLEKIFVITTTNCRRRLLDTQKIKLYFQRNNWNVLDKPDWADKIIIVTCAYRDEIAKDCLDYIKKLQNYSGELIVVGCLPDIESTKLKKIFNGKTISTKDLNLIDDYFPGNNISFKDISDADVISNWINPTQTNKAIYNILLIGKSYKYIQKNIIKYIFNPHLLLYLYPYEKNNYHIRISWGCLGNCTYCAIKKAIGPLKSKSMNECLNDFSIGLKKGFKNFIITADDVGAYGIDIGYTFPQLLEKLCSFNGDYNISIQDLDPKWIVKYINDLEEIFKKNKISSINIALQSGSKKILKIMNRYNNIEKISDSIRRLRKSSKKFSLDTHFILGFPSETRDDFYQSMKFVIENNFDMGFIYRFSLRSNTKADKIKPKNPQEEIDYRMLSAKKFLKKHKYKVLSLSKNSFYSFYR
jgi:tRNA A37 methylthiotransferase MiaB